MSTPFVVAVTGGGFIAHGFRPSFFGNPAFIFWVFRKCPAFAVGASLRKVFGKVFLGNPCFMFFGFSKLPGQPGNCSDESGGVFVLGNFPVGRAI